MRYLKPFFCGEACIEIGEVVPCCPVSGNNLGTHEGEWMTPRQYLKAFQSIPLAQRIHAWEVAHSRKLTTRQKEALDDLLDQYQLLMKQYHGRLHPCGCNKYHFDDNYKEEFISI